MDKEKYNARQQRYREKKARIEIMGTDALKKRFRELPGMPGLTNAQKLNELCQLWERRHELNRAQGQNTLPMEQTRPKKKQPPRDIKPLDPDVPPMPSGGKFKDHIRNVAMPIYKRLEIHEQYFSLSEAKQQLKDRPKLEMIKKKYSPTIAALFALGHIDVDLEWFAALDDKERKVRLWELVHRLNDRTQ